MANWFVRSVTGIGLALVVLGISFYSYFDIHEDASRFGDWEETHFAVYPYRHYAASFMFSGFALSVVGLALLWRIDTRTETILTMRTRNALFFSLVSIVSVLMWAGTLVSFDAGPAPVPMQALITAQLVSIVLFPVLVIAGLVIVYRLVIKRVRRQKEE
jgi:hypothetical protein